MKTLKHLIWMTHFRGINTVLTAICRGENGAPEVSALLSSLTADDTFNEYSEDELEVAINEIINE